MGANGGAGWRGAVPAAILWMATVIALALALILVLSHLLIRQPAVVERPGEPVQAEPAAEALARLAALRAENGRLEEQIAALERQLAADACASGSGRRP